MLSKLKNYLLATPPVLVIFYLFITYVPWLLGSQPIENIVNYELSNLPPPEGAVSFAINHGAALYYFEKMQLELTCASLAFFVSIAVVALLMKKNARKNT